MNETKDFYAIARMIYEYPSVLNKLYEGMAISIYIGWLESFSSLVTGCSYRLRVKGDPNAFNRIVLFNECRRILREGFELMGCEAVDHM